MVSVVPVEGRVGVGGVHSDALLASVRLDLTANLFRDGRSGGGVIGIDAGIAV